ncbi:MAG: class I SAM-dependent methyltransferase [Nanoarchaeota archaeon]|nr:class I SAM-dependent methyltransferase [Nanoarchaeota archaeon]
MNLNPPKLDERYKRILEFIEPRKNEKILVIGTGVFPKIEYFLFYDFGCKNIFSGDIDKKNIENGKKVLPGLEFLELDAQKKFPFKCGIFDKIIFTEVLEHLKNEDFALKGIKRVLKSDGDLILSVPKKRWFSIFSPIYWIQHKREYSENSIKKVLEKNGFKINKIIVGGGIYDLFNLWLHLIYKYVFKKLHVDNFFKEKIDKSWKKEFKGKGTDIIIKANKKLE